VSFENFQTYLDSTYSQHGLDFNRDFLSRMKDLAIDVYLSAKSTLNTSKRRNSFELFGFDYMIDEDFRVWLIEVNTNPFIGIHNKSMKHIVPNMFKELFKIVLDPVFEKEQPSNPEQGTQFDLLYSRTRAINKRRRADEGIYPVKELDQRAKIVKRPRIRTKVSKQKFDSIPKDTDFLNVSVNENSNKVTSRSRYSSVRPGKVDKVDTGSKTMNKIPSNTFLSP
jgi:hypothetical protein